MCDIYYFKRHFQAQSSSFMSHSEKFCRRFTTITFFCAVEKCNFSFESATTPTFGYYVSAASLQL